MKVLLSCFLFFFTCITVAQDELTWLKENQTDSLYREDQFYVGFSFNFLTDLPANVNQSGFSGGLIFGFIRDMPINKKRNLAIGLGLGFNLNTFGQNLKIEEVSGGQRLQILQPDQNYNTNRFTTNLIEIPLELRWRTSDFNTLSFWRIYFGVKFGYVLTSKSVFSGPEDSFNFSPIDFINKFRTSLKLTFGYGAVNFFVDASLNPVFNNPQIESTQEHVGIKPVKVGLVFFFL